jgi:SAM-dependent methyltransferase
MDQKNIVFDADRLDLSDIAPAHVEFLRLEFRRTPDYYRRRVAMLGFRGGEVLDAACGIGQWAVVLAQANSRVVGIDLTPDRIKIARRLAAANAAANVTFETGSIEEIPLPESSIDFVFCYGAIMFTDIDKTLSQFARVLRPGGKAYICGNCLGWSLYLMAVRGLGRCRGAMIRAGWGTIMTTWRGRRDGTKYLTPGGLARRARAAGFTDCRYGSEGTLNPAGQPRPPSVYAGRFLGFPCVGEWLLTR